VYMKSGDDVSSGTKRPRKLSSLEAGCRGIIDS
jgi:hypothetical protein